MRCSSCHTLLESART
ncbi:hypothetical protein DXT98_29720 [Agrobacterium sp. ICMP 7243]|nr:hypothetical protein DXT98_29720 [Agrobacterium sp. ICMP 7243]MQB34856.1 hypothetical protein [Rhizobium rhizogenes]TQO73615.1 hypothetical protein FFE80_30880 [Rhizobium rhizogenes]TRB18209.1 hypothetical protein EXN70_30620 [Rhizobium rhizogenes]TRB50709.1 hypothetical protein EXN69_30790 [Rhizobium rhizogenes]